MSKDREHTPNKCVMGSMRSMSYSFESAVANIIDNSISANCKNVILYFPLRSYDTLAVGILDDGKGMSSDKLFEAMRYGSDSEENGKLAFGDGSYCRCGTSNQLMRYML